MRNTCLSPAPRLSLRGSGCWVTHAAVPPTARQWRGPATQPLCHGRRQLTAQQACPGKQGLAALRYSQHTPRSTRVNIPAHVGWEDVGRATEPTNITLLLQPCRRDLLTCPAFKERMPCGSSVTQCNKSARALPHGGWMYFHLSALALPFKGCWNGQGCAACSLSYRPLSFYPE